jgi:hypothetical protein
VNVFDTGMAATDTEPTLNWHRANSQLSHPCGMGGGWVVGLQKLVTFFSGWVGLQKLITVWVDLILTRGVYRFKLIIQKICLKTTSGRGCIGL